MNKLEFSIKNYLNENDIYRDDSDMQSVIINSFYNQDNNLAVNDHAWIFKLEYIQKHFGRFAQYAQNEWKIIKKV